VDFGSGDVYALDAVSGCLNGSSRPAMMRRSIITWASTLDGQLAAVDLKTQKPAWAFHYDTSKQNLPAIQNPDGTLNFGAIMSESLYDDMVIAVSKSLSVGSILASPTWHVPTAICTLSLEYSLRGADGIFRVSASPLPPPS
jgi:hypothetical protein